MKKKIIISISSLIIVLVIGFFAFNKSGGQELKLNTATVTEEAVQLSVTATGYVQPVDKVDVGTQVSGVIEKIFVDFNSHVKKGQLLAELDKLTLNERVIQAEASLNSAQSELIYAQQNYNRNKQLYDVKAATEASFEEATNRLAQAETSVSNTRANLHQAKVNLAYAEIYSPIDGVVLNRAVEQGQTVAASFNTPTLFTIANDLKKMQVEADVDEADIGQVKVGQDVTFTVDAYNDDTFTGKVNQIRLQPTVTSNVVTYTVIIEAPNPDEKLFPGMTASVTIITKFETGLVIPVEALNTRFDEEVMKRLNISGPPTPPASVPPAFTPPMQASGPQRARRPDNGPTGVWVKSTQGIVRKPVQTGLSDGVFTIVGEGLQKGDTIVLSASFVKKNEVKNNAANPFMPGPPPRR